MEEEQYLDPSQYSNPEEIEKINEIVRKQRKNVPVAGEEFIRFKEPEYADEEEKQHLATLNHILARRSGLKDNEPLGRVLALTSINQRQKIKELRKIREEDKQKRKIADEEFEKQHQENKKKYLESIERTIENTLNPKPMTDAEIDQITDPVLRTNLQNWRQFFDERVISERKKLQIEKKRDIDTSDYGNRCYPSKQIEQFVEFSDELKKNIETLLGRGGDASQSQLAELDYEHLFSSLLSILQPILNEEQYTQLKGEIQIRRDFLTRKLGDAEPGNYSFFLKAFEKIVKTWSGIFKSAGLRYSISLIPARHDLKQERFEENVRRLRENNRYGQSLSVPMPTPQEVVNSKNMKIFYDTLKNRVSSLLGTVLPLGEEPSQAEIPDTKGDILKDLEDNEPASTEEIAGRIKTSKRTVRTHIKSLKNMGQVTSHKRGTGVLYARKGFDWKAWEKQHKK